MYEMKSKEGKYANMAIKEEEVCEGFQLIINVQTKKKEEKFLKVNLEFCKEQESCLAMLNFGNF